MKSRFLLAAGCMTLAIGAARASPVLTDLAVERDGDNQVASCRLLAGLTPERLEEIDSGLETTIGYRLLVYRRRAGLPDELVARHRVECTVRHDALTRQYTLTRRIDDELQDTKVTPDAEAMREFMTTLRRVPVVRADALHADQEYYLKAKADIGLIWRFYLIPWLLDTTWARVPILRVPEDSGRDARP